jgi:serine phosphatase RsbU (regulator of sigma subunit)
MTRDLLRVLLHDGASPATALRRLNQALLEHPTASRFCTVAVALLTPTGGDLRGPLCLAGHPEPVLVTAGGDATLVGTPGELLGVIETDDLALPEAEIVLSSGESLVFYTDGVTERRDETRMFGQGGVLAQLRQRPGASAETLAGGLEAAAQSFVASELRDDVAILGVRNSG